MLFKITNTQQTTNYTYKPINDKNKTNRSESNTHESTIIISDESRRKYNQSVKLEFITKSEDDRLIQQFRKALEEYNSPEAVEQRELAQLEKELAYNPLTDEFNLTVKGDFPENTLYHTVSEALKGKVANEYVYAVALTDSIRSAVSMKDKSVEERAAYREAALKQAEYVAENYFDNEEEKAVFLDDIYRHYENDLLREQGYVVFDNSDLEPFKEYSSPRDNGNVSYMALARAYMDEDTFESWNNNKASKEETDKFIRELVNNQGKWSKEIIQASERKAEQAEKAIAEVQEMFVSFDWQDGLFRVTGEGQPDYLAELMKWNEDMLNLFS